jgi:hypothetical protein
MLFEVRRTVVFILLIAFLILWVPSMIKLAYSGVFPGDEEVRIVNYLSSFDLKWTEIEKFEIGRWGMLPYVCRITLLSGERRHAIGIQERTNFPDGSGEKMVKELNLRVFEATHRSATGSYQSEVGSVTPTADLPKN